MSKVVGRLGSLAAIVLLAIGDLTAGAAAPEAAAVNFNRDIRPILSDTCFACHGPDAKQREADLRLDLKDRAFADLDGRRAIVPATTM